MKSTAIYCRVSTDNQESEGTSLQTQLEACRNYCQGKDYDVANRFSEAYSGLTLERPKLNELRELVRAGDIDVVVVYCLDRLSRDPTHGVILTQELEKHGVKLEAVTEDVDNTELGKLISYIRGYASKVEALKIKERTGRGKRARAREGRMSGGFHTTYGYDYIPVSQKNGGRRAINEDEAKWVKQIFHWLVNDGLTTGAIRDKLMVLRVPTKKGKHWIKSTVSSILKNPAYTGKTFAFASARHKGRRKPQEGWIEIPGDVTPAIITQELFEVAQRQLQVNRAKAIRNTKREYLLRGHLRCRQCGHTYVGAINLSHRKEGGYRRIYRCLGKRKDTSPVVRCHNKSWGAEKLEALVWQEIEHVLSNPDFIIAEIEKQRKDLEHLDNVGPELQLVERQLKALDREQEKLLQDALYRDFPESLVMVENKKIKGKRVTLEAQKVELKTQFNASQAAAISLPKLESFVELMRQKLTTLDYETKRLALDMLNIKVWLDNHNVEITGAVPIEDVAIVATQP